MLLWDKTRRLPPDLLQQVENQYGEHFPFEVRLQLAAWIEEKFGTALDVEGNAQHRQIAVNIGCQLLEQLEIKTNSLPNDPDKFLIKNNLLTILRDLKLRYESNTLGLYLALRQCLEFEMKINESVSPSTADQKAVDVNYQIDDLKNRNSVAGHRLNEVHQEQETFALEYRTFLENKKRAELLEENRSEEEKIKAQRNLQMMEDVIRAKFKSLSGGRTGLLNQYFENLSIARELQTLILENDIIRWKREQILVGNGKSVTLSLETIQIWCESLVSTLWSMRQQLKQLETDLIKLQDPKNPSCKATELLGEVTKLLSELVSGTFIIERQPPQVMKTNTRFTATVRLLVGGVLNVHMATPTVSVYIVSEAQANNLISSPPLIPKKKEDYSSGEILNGEGIMEYHSSSNQVSVVFRNLQLKKIKRTEKKGTESVMDEKFSVLFWSEFRIGDCEFQLWTLSLPVVVIVHGNQEAQALATVTWDNAFAKLGRRPFVVPDKVPWAEAAYALNMKWTAACGKSLTNGNLHYLACKVFRNSNLPRSLEQLSGLEMSWSQFCKEPLPGRTFTFWEWFYRILILTSSHMGALWKEGFIMGFVSKAEAESLLIKTQRSGTFLLRFSDSELGGITISYLQMPANAPPSVFNVAPFTTKNLTQRSMADVIFDIDSLTYLYPETHKSNFQKFASAQSQGEISISPAGYIKHVLVTQVEGVPKTKHEEYDNLMSGAIGENPNSVPSLVDSMDFDQNMEIVSLLGLDEASNSYM